ncbi:MAG: 23S rRNA (pseudouridine(1915)-N(3))-methyltransferase RlmH [Candidatus Gracilibacteria bacterium]|nr:23S rRNA (pseudouridine(1915)-N(3))-methyltransferase RlmH [Candidatus Gracilibacteria bacterium]
MIKIYIFADSYKVYEKAISEYEKRLGKDLKIEKLKCFKNSNSDLVIEKETDFLKKILEKNKGFKIILSPEGRKFNTQNFYEYIENKKQNYGDISFFIGGANGLDYKLLKNHSDLQLSLSDFTLPHSLALLVLVEQVYRLSMIKKGTNYDK